MFLSGAVKLASGDPTWKSLRALDVHFETQPLPTWIGWWAHQEPRGLAHASVALMFFIELAVPFLVFSRFTRRWAFAPLVLLQVLIGLTGNYAFFNVLTIALCLFLVDDGLFPARWRELAAARAAAPRRTWPRPVVLGVAAVLFAASLPPLLGTVGFGVPRALTSLEGAISPFRSVNGYGLFAVMTTRRNEIEVEGSRDGVTWLPYEFEWKPGDPQRRPRFVEPHQPRLDWQMWFAALSTYDQNPWFVSFLRRLLQGEPSVLRLLAKDPFPGAPPRYVRAVSYDYHFTTPAERRATGAWWKRTRNRLYCPTLSLASSGEGTATDETLVVPGD
jgi:hypothetical protein